MKGALQEMVCFTNKSENIPQKPAGGTPEFCAGVTQNKDRSINL